MTTAAAGRIGPNAIIQAAAALRSRVGDTRAEALMLGATGRSLDRMPREMVDEEEVIRLVHALRRQLDPALCEAVLRDAGARTADYLIAHRIPRLAQALMRVLPARLALRVLLAGIMRHTWTFAGSAQVALERPRGSAMQLVLLGCPMCRGARTQAPSCHFYAATLERLLTRLVARGARVQETRCEGRGDAGCAFALNVTAR